MRSSWPGLNPLDPHHAIALGARRVFQVIDSPFHGEISAAPRGVSIVGKGPVGEIHPTDPNNRAPLPRKAKLPQVQRS